MTQSAAALKKVHWMGSSLKEVRAFPEEVREEIGFTLYAAQRGHSLINSVPLVGFGSAKVVEVAIDDDGDTYRAVYTVKFRNAVYVLHAFQKKSKEGCKTPKPDMDLVRSRLKKAEEHYEQMYPKKAQRERSHEHGA
jgi:phage-related protein